MAATGRGPPRRAIGAGLQVRCHAGSLSATLPWHQRIGAAADGKGAHQQQRHVIGPLYRRGRLDRNRPAPTEFLVCFLLHDQEIIEAALSAPAASEASPSQIAAASSPAAIRADRFGTGILTMK